MRKSKSMKRKNMFSLCETAKILTKIIEKIFKKKEENFNKVKAKRKKDKIFLQKNIKNWKRGKRNDKEIAKNILFFLHKNRDVRKKRKFTKTKSKKEKKKFFGFKKSEKVKKEKYKMFLARTENTLKKWKESNKYEGKGVK